MLFFAAGKKNVYLPLLKTRIRHTFDANKHLRISGEKWKRGKKLCTGMFLRVSTCFAGFAISPINLLKPQLHNFMFCMNLGFFNILHYLKRFFHFPQYNIEKLFIYPNTQYYFKINIFCLIKSMIYDTFLFWLSKNHINAV